MKKVLNNLPVIVMGGGGHAKVLITALHAANKNILGLTDPLFEKGSEILGVKVLGDDSFIENHSPNDIMLVNGIGALPYQELRKRLAKKIRDKGYSFLSIIHPTAIISDNVILSEGCQIMAGVVIQPGTRIERDCIINTGVLVDHDCVVEKDTHLAPGVVCCGGVTIGKSVNIGAGTTVIHNITIGAQSVIAAGSTIYKDVPPNVTIIQTCQEKINKNV